MASRKRRAAQRLHSAAIHLLRALRTADAATDLTPARLSVLSILVFGGEHSLTRIAEMEGVTAATMSRIIARLEADEFVVRVADPRDGRASILRATKRAERILMDARDKRIDVFEQLIDGTTPAEIDTLDRAASIIERLLRQ